MYMYLFIHVYTDPLAKTTHIFAGVHSYRVAKTHRIPYLYRSFSAKEPYI